MAFFDVIDEIDKLLLEELLDEEANKMDTNNDKPLVIYHDDCRDGFCAAWVMSKYLPNAEFFPASYNQTPPDVKNRIVWIVDFSYKRAILMKMFEDAKSLVVLDHHKTAEEDLKGLDFAHFDMNRSGAGLAWDWFNNPRGSENIRKYERPWIVDYVEDRDLWRFKLSASHEVNAYISALPYDFKAWDNAAFTMLANNASLLGTAIKMEIDSYIAATIQSNSYIGSALGFYDIPIINAPRHNVSELLHELLNKYPDAKFVVGWRRKADMMYEYSLRSNDKIDVSDVAKVYGGGGHKNAAGINSRHMLV